MKTVTELIADAKAAQTAVANLCRELTELEASSRQEETDIHISDFMQTARHNPIAKHILGETKDNLAVEAYFTLLFAVATKNVPADCNMHPIIYPCRVAASFSPEPDVELYFKKSLVLDEKTMHRYIDAVLSQDLRDNFVIDSLLMTALYDKGNLAKLDFIADLAGLFTIDREEMDEILFVVSSIVDEVEFVEHYFGKLNFHRIKYYFNKCNVFMITMPDEVFYGGNGQGYISIDEQVKITNKKIVNFINIDISNVNFEPTNYYGFSIKNVESVFFADCTFSNVSNPLFNFQDIGRISIHNCRFSHFSSSVFEFRKIVDVIEISDSKFDDCYRKTREGYDNLKYGGVIAATYGLKKLTVEDCTFDDCRVKRLRSHGSLWETTGYNNRLFSGQGYSERIYTDATFERCENSGSCDYYS